MAKKTGMEWVEGIFGLKPRWMAEPDIEKIESLARRYLKIEQDDPCYVTFHSQGAFNKLYKIETESNSVLMRLALPVDPCNKTNSEVATIEFVRQNTDIPVPQIFGFDDSAENELGFEWILMEMLPGETLRTKWRKLSEDVKRDVVTQMARYQAQLFRHNFSSIGNIFIKTGTEHQNLSPILSGTDPAHQERQATLPELGRLVSLSFFWGDHITQDVPRGPFTRTEDWIRARLTLVLTDQERILNTSADEGEIEDAEDVKSLAKRLLELLPNVFPSSDRSAERTILFHDDLSMQNILVDGDGKITGVVDWECVSALPFWKACGMPGFLTGRERTERPKRDGYAPDSDDENTLEDTGEFSEVVLDNEGVNCLYWEHLMEYELTILREHFLKEMEILTPEWKEEWEQGAFQADFEEAVLYCDSGWCTKKINSWLNELERGKSGDLRKQLLE